MHVERVDLHVGGQVSLGVVVVVAVVMIDVVDLVTW